MVQAGIDIIIDICLRSYTNIWLGKDSSWSRGLRWGFVPCTTCVSVSLSFALQVRRFMEKSHSQPSRVFLTARTPRWKRFLLKGRKSFSSGVCRVSTRRTVLMSRWAGTWALPRRHEQIFPWNYFSAMFLFLSCVPGGDGCAVSPCKKALRSILGHERLLVEANWFWNSASPYIEGPFIWRSWSRDFISRPFNTTTPDR